MFDVSRTWGKFIVYKLYLVTHTQRNLSRIIAWSIILVSRTIDTSKILVSLLLFYSYELWTSISDRVFLLQTFPNFEFQPLLDYHLIKEFNKIAWEPGCSTLNTQVTSHLRIIHPSTYVKSFLPSFPHSFLAFLLSSFLLPLLITLQNSVPNYASFHYISLCLDICAVNQ